MEVHEAVSGSYQERLGAGEEVRSDTATQGEVFKDERVCRQWPLLEQGAIYKSLEFIFRANLLFSLLQQVRLNRCSVVNSWWRAKHQVLQGMWPQEDRWSHSYTELPVTCSWTCNLNDWMGFSFAQLLCAMTRSIKPSSSIYESAVQIMQWEDVLQRLLTTYLGRGKGI